jgi:hypothetical protein
VNEVLYKTLQYPVVIDRLIILTNMLTDCYIYDILLINLLLLAVLIGDVKQQSNRKNHIDLYNINQSIDSVQSIYQLICEIHQEGSKKKTFYYVCQHKSVVLESRFKILSELFLHMQ